MANSWYAAGANNGGGGTAMSCGGNKPGGPAPSARTTTTTTTGLGTGQTLREKCEALRLKVGNRSSWDIGLLLAVAAVVIAVSAVNLALMDREDNVLQRYRAVFRHVRERRLVATAQLPDPEVFVRVDEAGEHAQPQDLKTLRDAAYWLNVALIFVASIALIVAIGALAIRNLPPLAESVGTTAM